MQYLSNRFGCAETVALQRGQEKALFKPPQPLARVALPFATLNAYVVIARLRKGADYGDKRLA